MTTSELQRTNATLAVNINLCPTRSLALAVQTKNAKLGFLESSNKQHPETERERERGREKEREREREKVVFRVSSFCGYSLITHWSHQFKQTQNQLSLEL